MAGTMHPGPGTDTRTREPDTPTGPLRQVVRVVLLGLTLAALVAAAAVLPVLLA